MHKLLIKQLKKLTLDVEKAPSKEQWALFIKKINQAYNDSDQDRYLLQRSLDIASQEMNTLYQNQKLDFEAREQSILNAMPDIVFLLNEDGFYLDILANDDPDLLFDAKKLLIGKKICDVIPQKTSSLFLSAIKNAIKTNKLQKLEYELDVGKGLTYFEGRVISTGQTENNKKTVLFLARDISDAKKTLEQHNLLNKVMQSAAEGLVIVSADKRVMYANDAMANITGLSVEQLISEGEGFLRHEKDIDLCANICQLAHTQDHIQKEITVHIGDNEETPVLLNLTALRDENNNLEYFMGVLSDMSEIQHSKDQLKYMANHDVLTQLPNRLLFIERFNQSLARVKRQNEQGALLFLDLDNFKNVNDSLGHSAGDELLIEVAKRLQKLCRAEDTVARFGGDEFVIILESIGASIHVFSFIDKLLKAFKERITIQGYELEVSTSIGITIFPEQGRDTEALLKQADTAMYAAKKEGKNRAHLFTTELLDNTVAGFTLDLELRHALDNNEFYMVYQPQYALNSKELTGFEALIRWQHPQKGLISPAQFIPAAEATGLIDRIGIWVFRQVCLQVVKWSEAHLKFCKISFNLSQRQLVDSELFNKLMNCLVETGAKKYAQNLICEITESAIIDNADNAYHNLQSLTEHGIKLSIDDFGTGHSSLINLKRFPLSYLKIDRSFIADVGKDSNDEAIIEASIALAKSFNLKVVAEGVETQEQETFLITLGCQHVQGYFYSQPLTVKDAETLLKTK